MTTEDDFQRALDARPDDWQTRLVFADWLDERGDQRGPGYRALGMWRRKPERYKTRPPSWSWHGNNFGRTPSSLVPEWWALLVGPVPPGFMNTKDWHFRRAAEDAAALAFAQLPSERRAELLAVPTARSA